MGANASEASDVRCGIHYVEAREEMTTLVDESSHFILKLLFVNHHYQWFSHHMHHKEESSQSDSTHNMYWDVHGRLWSVLLCLQKIMTNKDVLGRCTADYPAMSWAWWYK